MSTASDSRTTQELLEVLEEIEYFAEQSYRRILRRVSEVREILHRGSVAPHGERSLSSQLIDVDRRRQAPSPPQPVGRAVAVTSTEAAVLDLLRASSEGSSAPTIARQLGKTREHTARLLKKMCDEGHLVRREDVWPFLYTLSAQPDRTQVGTGDDT